MTDAAPVTDREQWRNRLAEDLRRGGEPWPGAPSPGVVADALLPVVAGIVEDDARRAVDTANSPPHIAPGMVVRIAGPDVLYVVRSLETAGPEAILYLRTVDGQSWSADR